ncbi:MAG: sulfite oxidase-like oxidoreductase [Chloroflexi bacterium]|nr:sulfite oxidase-like oxidoreductase [Chloroflexota bacterium]
MAFEFLRRGATKTQNLDELHKRLPPGQRLVRDFPVLHVGPIPPFDPKTWNFRIFGFLEKEVTLTYTQFMHLPQVTVTADMHCGTGWTKLDNVWEGVAFREVMQLACPRPEARYVIVHAEYGYTTNLPLAVLLEDDVLFAYRHNGANLTPEHGWPLRLVVPSRYAWKSAKWVRGIEFVAEDRPGYWEQFGYHNNADPLHEERLWND